jgi:hypothetical protein
MLYFGARATTFDLHFKCFTSTAEGRLYIPTPFLLIWRHIIIIVICTFIGWDQRVKPHMAVGRVCHPIVHHFIESTNPSHCCAWLIPILFNCHWYFLVLDWVGTKLYIYDSLAKSGPSQEPLLHFGSALVALATEEFHLNEQTWSIEFEKVCSICYYFE